MMKTMKRKQAKRITCAFGVLIGCILILWPAVLYSQVWKRIENRPQTLGLEQGLLEFVRAENSEGITYGGCSDARRPRRF